MNYNSYVKRFQLKTAQGRHMTKSIARGFKKGLVDQCFGDEVIHGYILKKTAQIIREEVKAMCSDEVDSVLRNSGKPDALSSFTWNSLLAELKRHAPTLLLLLSAAAGKRAENSECVIGMCSAMLLKSPLSAADPSTVHSPASWLQTLPRTRFAASPS